MTAVDTRPAVAPARTPHRPGDILVQVYGALGFAGVAAGFVGTVAGGHVGQGVAMLAATGAVTGGVALFAERRRRGLQ